MLRNKQMEFFLPGLLIFILAVGITAALAPHFTPLFTAVLSIVFLCYGVYDHYQLFASEYRLSTWQDTLIIYAPAVMIFGTIIFVIYGILAFFTSGHVPVPDLSSLSNISVPSVESISQYTTNSMNGIKKSISSSINSVTNAVSKSANSYQNKNKNITRSALETL